MNLKRCDNGHFFDADQYDKCPHCGALNKRNDNETVALSKPDFNDQVTGNLKQSAGASGTSSSLQKAVNSAMASGISNDDDSKTVGYYSKAIGSEPVVGWLVCIEGSHFGEDFRLKTGRNFIGRSSDMDVCLSADNSVSREKHAVILFEPRGCVYIVQSGESRELFYLNEKVVLASETITQNDILTIGATKLMFFPCCNDKFSWESLKKTSEKV